MFSKACKVDPSRLLVGFSLQFKLLNFAGCSQFLKLARLDPFCLIAGCFLQFKLINSAGSESISNACKV